MIRRTIAGITAAGALLVLASCTDQREPVGPSETPSGPDLAPAQGTANDPAALARSIPGFGGFFIDVQGAPTIYLRDPSLRGRAEQALAPYLRAQGFGPGRLKVLKGDYDWAQLEGWFTGASAEALAVRGAVFVDADEASNRVRIGVEPGAGGRVRAALAKLRMPDAAVIVEERAPVTYAVAQGPKPKAKPGSGPSLQGQVRPIIGGVQINFPGLPLHPRLQCDQRLRYCLALHQHPGRHREYPVLATDEDGQPDPDRHRGRGSTVLRARSRAARPVGFVVAATPPGRPTSTAPASPSGGSHGRIVQDARSRSSVTSESPPRARRSSGTW